MGDATPDDGRSQDHEPAPSLWWDHARNGLLVAVFVVMVWLAFTVRLPSIDEMRASVDASSWTAWIGFVVAYAVVAITPIPVTIMAVAGGVLFGLVEGTLLSLVGVLLGCWAAYWLARGLGKSTVRRLLGRHASTVERRLDSRGFLAVYALRLMPGIPYWPVNYGSGAFGVSQRDYVVASVVAVIPGQLSLVAIGAFVAHPSILDGAVVVVAWIIVIALTIWAYRSWKGTARRPLPGQRLTDRTG